MQTEGEKIEYKRSLGVMNEILESIVAFANTQGGEIDIGIEDTGKTVGISLGKNTIDNLFATIAREIEPKITVSIKPAEREGKTILLITIPSSPLKPHFFKGVAYQRAGTSNRKLSPQQLEEMLVKRVLSLHDIDSLPLNVKPSDISEEFVKQYVKELGKGYRGRGHALQSLGLTEDGKAYPSAVLFFGRDPAQFFPLYGVKCAVFKGVEMLTIRDFPLSVYAAVKPVLVFLKQHIPSTVRFEGIKRYEEPAIPEAVLREALLNALVHADYTLDATIYIQITEDFLEIKNGGTLPAPLTVEELEKPHLSKPRNRRIADLCHRIGWIEHWGEGTLKIVREMQARALDVQFEEKNGYFSVRLYLRPLSLNARQQRIFQAIRKWKSATTKKLISLRIPERTVRADLAFLSQKGLIQKTGKGNQTRYSV